MGCRLRQTANNDTFTDLNERVYERTRVTMRRVALLPGRSETGITQYRAVLAAIVRGDADEAELKIRELNRSAREYMLRYKNFVL
ncbi:FCD domain-containing protein [Caenimonas sp. SL110]|uniref:FCD domain-containing protein n=1 Tax=Caenimonas sp. SL110 TaxID=1450524 RepID=UPI0009E565A1|nr:FCD domain-containing protein [Caenimonas sp. SL110]